MSYVLVVLIYKVLIFQRKNNICQVTVLRPLYLTYYVMSCLLICKNINSAYLKGKNILMNVFNTNIYFICFIPYLCLNLKININHSFPYFQSTRFT